jgi:dTMP kinase
MVRGILLACEGIDGSGKSSTARLLTAHLQEQHIPVLLTQEPRATPLGKELRNLLHERSVSISEKSEFLLFAADRAQHMVQIIEPAIAEGRVVISDRFSDSSLAYQGYGRGLDKKMIDQINRWALSDRTPDLTIYMKVDYETALARIQARNAQLTSFEKEKKLFFERVITGFDELYAYNPSVITIDATRDLDMVSAQAIESVMIWLHKQGIA